MKEPVNFCRNSFFSSILWQKTISSTYLQYFSNCFCIIEVPFSDSDQLTGNLFHKYTIYTNYNDCNALCRLPSLIHIHKALTFGYQLTFILDKKLLDSHCGVLHFLPFVLFFLFVSNMFHDLICVRTNFVLLTYK